METNGVVKICLAVLDSFLQINGFRNECFAFPPKPLPAPVGNPTVWARALEVISLSIPASQLRYFCLTNLNSISFSPHERPGPQLKWSLCQTSPTGASVPRMVSHSHLHDNMLIKIFFLPKMLWKLLYHKRSCAVEIGTCIDSLYKCRYLRTGTPHFVAFHFIVLHWYCVFYKSKVHGNWASGKSVGAIFPIFAHFGVSVSHFCNSFNISIFFLVIIFVMVICAQWPLVLLLYLS